MLVARDSMCRKGTDGKSAPDPGTSLLPLARQP